jgi:glycine/D-amino acid oxidase-like deaminating enzyme
VRVTIVGVGAIGAVLGWQLSEAGHEVAHLVRPGRAAALAWSGVRIRYADLRVPQAAAPGTRRRMGRGESFDGEALYQPELAEALPDGGGDFVLAPVWPRQLAPLAEYLAGRGVRAEVVFMGTWAGGGDEILPFLRLSAFSAPIPAPSAPSGPATVSAQCAGRPARGHGRWRTRWTPHARLWAPG